VLQILYNMQILTVISDIWVLKIRIKVQQAEYLTDSFAAEERKFNSTIATSVFGPFCYIFFLSPPQGCSTCHQNYIRSSSNLPCNTGKKTFTSWLK